MNHRHKRTYQVSESVFSTRSVAALQFAIFLLRNQSTNTRGGEGQYNTSKVLHCSARGTNEASVNCTFLAKYLAKLLVVITSKRGIAYNF